MKFHSIKFKISVLYVLQVGTSLRPIISILRNRLLFTAISLSVILVLAVFSGQIFASHILKPVVDQFLKAEYSFEIRSFLMLF